MISEELIFSLVVWYLLPYSASNPTLYWSVTDGCLKTLWTLVRNDVTYCWTWPRSKSI